MTAARPDAAGNARLALHARVARGPAVERGASGRHAARHKTVLNELIAYVELARMTDLSERSRMPMTYALCGFATSAASASRSAA
jgi:hypothetical protein